MKILIFILFISFSVSAQANLDSLLTVWNSPSQPDTNRLKAFNNYIRKGYLLSDPDSAFYFAGLQYNFAVKKGLEKYIAQALINKGLSYYVKSDYPKALEYYEKSRKIYEKLGIKKEVATIFYNTGIIYSFTGEYQKAIANYKKSLKLCQEMDDKPGVASAYNGLGVVYKDQGNEAKAIEYYTKSLKINEELGDKKGIASVSENTGNIYKHQEHYDEAVEHYKKSLKIYKEIGYNRGVASASNNLGIVYKNQGNYTKAVKYYNTSLEINKKLGNRKGIASSLNNIGILYKSQGNYEKAIGFFEESLKIKKEINDREGIASSLKSIGDFHLYKRNYQKALQYGNQSLNIAQSIGSAGKILEASKLLWKVNRKLGRYKEGLKMYELFIKTRDSIKSEANQKELIRQEYKYQYEKQAAADSVKAAEAAKVKDAQLSAEKAENKRHQIEAKQQRQQKYFLYGGLALALVFGGFIFNRFRVTRKQKGVIEEQKEKVDVAYEQLGEKNQEILDSINYAKRIQSAILPPQKLVKEYIPDSFILYKPKDIVAGDFYWMEHTEDQILFAAADCTGHGVPGAMVSVVCNNGLNRSVREHGLTQPAKILDKTREIVIAEFEKSEEEVKDGMDIALVALQNEKQNENDDPHSPHSFSLCYSGAHNPLWIICSKERHPEVILSLSKGDEGESGQTDEKQFLVFEDPENDHVLIEIKADKQPIGKFGAEKPFTNHKVELQKGDSVYIFSDGYADQFGGEKGKKFKSKNFKKLLLSIQNEKMERQRQLLDEAFEEWKGDIEQLDDVCVIGVRL